MNVHGFNIEENAVPAYQKLVASIHHRKRHELYSLTASLQSEVAKLQETQDHGLFYANPQDIADDQLLLHLVKDEIARREQNNTANSARLRR